MKPQLFGIVLILVLLIAGAYFYGKQMFTQEPVAIPGATGENLYANGTYGFSFVYPDYYVLTEQEVGNAERMHYAVTLVDTDDTVLPEGGEGPTAITIDVYQNNLDKQTLDDWLETNQSNFKLGAGTRAVTSVGGKEAITYSWSGLYEGETTAFIHGDNIIAISVTYFSRTDQIRADYLALLASFTAP